MGDRLYQDPYAFVRELVQNALDASRHREFHERSAGGALFVAEPVSVRTWLDATGYQWVEVTDHGMGMTEEIIREFLLRVGRSYYTSARFEADTIRYSRHLHQNFRPISRFGIGLLSCFIVGDRVEISTRHAAAGDGLIRLSLPGLQSFFTLQRYPNQPRPMPAPEGSTPADRSAGSTVAVRLDARRDPAVLDLRRQLDSHVLCPPVAVLLEGEPVGLRAEDLLLQPWCLPTRVALPRAITRQLGDVLDYRFLKRPIVRLVPADITRDSPAPDIQGQAVAAYIEPSKEWASGIDADSEVRRNEVELSFSQDGAQLILTAKHWEESVSDDDSPAHEATLKMDIARHWRLSPDLRQKLFAVETRGFDSRVGIVSHNGIRVPRPRGFGGFFSHPLLANIKLGGYGCSWGVLALRDKLRPDLSIDRDETIGVKWPVRSATLLAFRRALSRHLPPRLLSSLRDSFETGRGTRLLGDAINDPLMTDEAMWPAEKMFSTGRGTVSIVDLLDDGDLEVSLPTIPGSADLDFVRASLAHIWLSVRAVRDARTRLPKLLASGPRGQPLRESERLFPPLAFVEFQGIGTELRPWLPNVDRGHPLSEWVLDRGVVLNSNLGGLFARIRHALTSGSEPAEINQILQRIATLRPELAPPKSAYLKDEES